MKKLSKILTAVTILSISGASSTTAFARQCEEVKLGEYKKTLWGKSFRDGLRGELVKQLAKKDDLFERISPEIEIGLNNHVDLKFKLSRAVKDNLPVPTNNTIGLNDFFTYKVQNKLHVEFKGKASAGILFSEGAAGINIVHSSDHFPGKKMSACEIYNTIIDANTEKGREFIRAACEGRDKTSFSVYYEKFVDFLSMGTNKFFNYFADSEKNKKFAEDSLSPLKLHSMLGVPLDHKVFFENNTEIAIGDVIEHTTFYSIKPLGVALDIFEFFRPSHSRFKRIFRSIGFKKVLGNKVIVEVEDTQISGDNTEIYKIRPKFFGFLKLNLGKWSDEDFTEESLVQRFEIDLTKDEGVKFFKKLLLSAYTPKLDLNRNSILIDHSKYQSSVLAHSPVYRNGYGGDSLIVFKLPGTFHYENRDYFDVTKIWFEGNEYLTGERLLRNRLKSEISVDLGLFEIEKKDRNYECKMKIEAQDANYVANSSAMNIECNYFNRYSNNEIVSDVHESLMMTLDGKMQNDDYAALANLNYPKKDKLTMYTNLSFSAEQIKKIVDTEEDQIYAEISKMLFGEEAQNIFAKRYHKLWKRARRDRSVTVVKNRKIYKDCSIMLAKFEILPEVDPIYSEFGGIVGNSKGIDNYKTSICYNYFRMARDVVRNIKELKNGLVGSGDVDAEDMLDIFSNLNKAGIIQNLLVRLAGGVSTDKVRFVYIVTSPYLDHSVIQANGRKYKANLPTIRRGVLEDLDGAFFPRIAKVSYSVNKCNLNELNVDLDLAYPLEDLVNSKVKVKLNTYSLGRERPLMSYSGSFAGMTQNDEKSFRFTVPVNGNIDPNEPNNIYIKIQNQDDFSLSKEVKTFLKKVNEDSLN